MSLSIEEKQNMITEIAINPMIVHMEQVYHNA